MDLIFDKKAFNAVKENLNKAQFVDGGHTEKLNLKPGDASVPVSQKTDPLAGKFQEPGEVEKLDYPTKTSAVTAEAHKFISEKIATLRGEGKGEAEASAIAYSMAREKGYEVPEVKNASKESSMNKESAQQLPGTDKVDAASAIEKGEKGKLQFPTKPAADPKVSQQGLDKSKDAQKQIDGGEKGKINHGGGAAKAIKIDWNVTTDAKIGHEFQEAGDKGDLKKVKGPAKEPGVSQKVEPGADAFMDAGETAKPIQKQFSVNWQRQSAEEQKEIADQALTCAISDLEVVASKYGMKIENSRLAPVYAGLIALRDGITKEGGLFLNVQPAAPAPAAPLKTTASVKTAVDEDKAAIEVGKQIF
jgi:hypothetical protein